MSDWSYADEERELRLEQMRADIRLKKAQAQGEPWKTVIAAVTCMAAIFTAIGYFIGSHR